MLSDLIRLQLLRDPSVRFSGYRMPHPLIFDCHVKVQTIDSRTNPIKVFEAALEDLGMEAEILERQFDRALEDFENQQGM